MNLICGEALGITCGTWLGLWNGAIGAFVAAVIGGGVALMVVRLTNAQQRRGVERTVEIAAISEFVAALEELDSELRNVSGLEFFDPSRLQLMMKTAATKLLMTSPDAEPLARILLPLAFRIGRLALQYQRAKFRQDPTAEEIIQTISGTSSTVMVCLPKCLDSRRKWRSASFTQIKETCEKVTVELNRFSAILDRETEDDSGSSRDGIF